MKKENLLIIITLVLASCTAGNHTPDAYGNFEATEVVVSAQASGKVMQLDITEGQSLEKSKVVGYVDTMQLHLKQEQLKASIAALLSKAPDIPTQINVLREQITALDVEKRRLNNLFAAEAATQKQLDDVNSQIDILKKQISAQTSTLNIQSKSILSETEPLKKQIEQLEDQINKSIIVNPISGVVLTKYVEKEEVVTFGKPLYRIADISNMILQAYVSGSQLSQIAIGQPVRVLIDQDEDTYKELDGNISWIAFKAEFTPKTIQTKDERVNLVYAVKVMVKNDGGLKIGMPGEVVFRSEIAQKNSH